MNVGCAVAVEPCAVIGKREEVAGVHASILAVVCAIDYPHVDLGGRLCNRLSFPHGRCLSFCVGFGLQSHVV